MAYLYVIEIIKIPSPPPPQKKKKPKKTLYTE